MSTKQSTSNSVPAEPTTTTLKVELDRATEAIKKQARNMSRMGHMIRDVERRTSAREREDIIG